MAKNKKQRGPILRTSTPPGKAVWPYIDRPSTTFNEDGTYKCDLRFSPDDPEWAAFMVVMEKHVQACVDELGKNLPLTQPIRDHLDEDGNPTGDKLLKTKLNATIGQGEDKTEQRPIVYDSALTVLDPVPKIGGGSTLVLSLDVGSRVVHGNLYVTAYMVGVSIHDLKTYGQHTPEAYGMKAAEGFTAVANIEPVNTSEAVKATDIEGDY